MRRRITWHLDTRTAIALVIGEALPIVFKWRDLPRPLDEKKTPQLVFRDFEPGEARVQMLWEGTQCEKFTDEVQLKTYIMRFVYNINIQHLIPSEVLADAGLVYETRDWVDEWYCTDKNSEIVKASGTICRPSTRKIRFLENVKRDYRGHEAPRSYAYVTTPVHQRKYYQGYEIAAKPDLSDVKCFYVFKAGGHYETRSGVSASDRTKEASESQTPGLTVNRQW